MNTYNISKVIGSVLFSALALGSACKSEEPQEVLQLSWRRYDDQNSPSYPWLRTCSEERIPLNELIEILV